MLWVRATGSIWVISALSHIPWIVHFMTHSLYKVITQPAALGMNVSHWAAAYRIFVLLISLCTQGKAFQAQQEIPQVHPGKVNSAFFEGGWKPVLPHIYWGLGHIWSCDAGMVTWSEKAPRRCSQLCRRVLGAAAASCIVFFFFFEATQEISRRQGWAFTVPLSSTCLLWYFLWSTFPFFPPNQPDVTGMAIRSGSN